MEYTYTDGLGSDRLVTRFLHENDVLAWKAFISDPGSMEFFPNVLSETDDQRASTWIRRQMERYTEQAYGLQALIHRDTGEFIGQCGLLLQEIDGVKEIEIGYHIFKEHRGRGYAPEAARIFMNYAFGVLELPTIISIIHCENVKSQRVAEKNLLVKEKQTQWRDKPVFVYRAYRK